MFVDSEFVAGEFVGTDFLLDNEYLLTFCSQEIQDQHELLEIGVFSVANTVLPVFPLMPVLQLLSLTAGSSNSSSKLLISFGKENMK